MNEQPIKPRSYKVTLKSGDYAVFTNRNHFENYENRLISGIYGIVKGSGQNLPINADTVLSIEEIEEEQTTDSELHN